MMYIKWGFGFVWCTVCGFLVLSDSSPLHIPYVGGQFEKLMIFIMLCAVPFLAAVAYEYRNRE